MTAQRAKIVSMPGSAPAVENTRVREDEFLSASDLVPVRRDSADRRLRQVLSELSEMTREKRWEDAVALFYPVDEQLPELVACNLDGRVREKLAFALGQMGRFDDAIAELQKCAKADPDNFFVHNSLAYTAYNSLYAAANREIFLSGKLRAERIQLAHKHFTTARALRPDGVVNFYREGMLYRKLEGKNTPALPLFQQAVENWEKMDEGQRETMHKDRKNYIKSLYQLSACLLDAGRPEMALNRMKQCIREDKGSGYVSEVFKRFAMGKVFHSLERFDEAEKALQAALQQAGRSPVDYVYELLARTLLAMGDPARALEAVENVPENRRRPYVRWTEADVRCTMEDYTGARRTLLKSVERDRLSRHKGSMRLARIEYLLGDYRKTVEHARNARKFYQDRWGNFFEEGWFWEALGSFRSGNIPDARKAADALLEVNPEYPNLSLLVRQIREQEG